MPDWKTQYNRLRVRAATSSNPRSKKRYDSAARDIAKGESPKVRIHSKNHESDERTRRQMQEALLHNRRRRRGRRGKIPGGMAEGKTVADIARKHGMSVTKIESAIRRGVRLEKEHTTDPSIAREIAKDHIYENPRYYEVLARKEGIRPGRKKKTETNISKDKEEKKDDKEDKVNEEAPTNNVGNGKIAGTSPGEQPPIKSHIQKIKGLFNKRLHRR
jgi:hypothetical protein